MKKLQIAVICLIVILLSPLCQAAVRAQTIPQSGWRLLYVDSQEVVGENGAAVNSFDGNAGTFWHTQWYPSSAPLPHEIQIDLGQTYYVNGFSYLPRQDGSTHGWIGQYEFYVSYDGKNWGSPVATGIFANNALTKTILFSAAAGRYVRLRALTEVNGNSWTSMAELNVLGNAATGPLPPKGVISSPTQSMVINAGDHVNFAGNGTDPGNNLPLKYLWHFSAGSGISDITVQNPGYVQFNNVGTYTVTLTVTDTLGLSDPAPPTLTITVRQAPISHSGWSLHYVDSQEIVAENDAAVNSFDGNPATFWHTQWYPSSAPLPHEIQINLGQMINIDGFRYSPRQDGGQNGWIGQYEFYTSYDGVNWGSPIARGTFPSNALEKEVLFAPTVCQYVRLRALTEVNGNSWTSMAELNVLGNAATGPLPPKGVISNPTANMVINAGDEVNFAGTGTDPGNNLPLKYLWHFSAGSGVSDMTVQNPGLVQFNNVGTYTVTLTVTDSLGLSDPAPPTLTVTVRQGAIPRTGWTLLYVDSQEIVAENDAAVNSFDGNTATFWHTQWYSASPPPPHEIQIDLGQINNIDGFRYLPRQDGSPNGRIGQYEFYVSSDGIYWGSPVATGTFTNDAIEKQVMFTTTTGRYIRLRALTEVNGHPWTSMAELNVLGSSLSGPLPPKGALISPTANMVINAGDQVYLSGKGTDPGKNLPLTYAWHFSAGSGVSDTTLQSPGLVQFNYVGTYTVTFTVTNSVGLSDPVPPTFTITVREAPIPQTGWKLLYVDSQEIVAENDAAVNSFDGNKATFWHTQWYSASPPPPHEIQIDLGQKINIDGFRYLPRQDGGLNGRIGQYEFYVSSDGKSWGSPVATGNFANDALEKEVLFPSTAGRYIRLRALTEVNGNPWTSMAEINVLGNPVSGAFPPKGLINGPTSDMVISPGNKVNFAGIGSDLGNNFPLKYLWHFSAGSGIADTTVQNPGLVQFNNVGTYTVTLTVTDSLGLSDPAPPTRTITVQSMLPLLPDFYSITVSPFNLIPAAGIAMPVISGKDVTDIAAPRGVSDPFLFHDDDGSWHMFLEVIASDYSRIAHATSPDGLHWTYDRIVLQEADYHSYPSVLKYNGNYYMIPESYVFNGVRVYQAGSFPYNWSYVATLISGKPFVDPQVFRYNNTWWMFVSDTANLNCYLYYSDNLLSGWVEHPMSPIIKNDAGSARGGGRAFVANNGQIYRTVQKDDVIYGEAVRVFAVDVITKTNYAEHEIPQSPVLGPSGIGWNATGMHHWDPWWAGDKWIGSVDGLYYPVELNGDGIGSIGIYTSQ